MNIREDDQVSAVALVMEEEASTAASAETVDPETVAGPADDPALATATEDADVLEEAGPADPTDEATITPPEVDADDVEP
jgi:hypothetical protein